MRSFLARAIPLLAVALTACSSSTGEVTDEVPGDDAASDATDATTTPDSTSAADADATSAADATLDAASETSAAETAAGDTAAASDAASADSNVSAEDASSDTSAVDVANPTDVTSLDAAGEDAQTADASDSADAYDASDSADAYDASDSADAYDASDSAPSNTLPGAACTGALTDQGLVDLYVNKPTVTIPFILGGNTQARVLGNYTSVLYKRSCNSNTGCDAWAVTTQPNYADYYSINTTIRQGKLYLRNQSGVNKLVIISDTVGTDCKGWTEGQGDVVRVGTNATTTLATKVNDSCSAGADPVFYFEQKDLVDPTGIVTDHCMKLVFTNERNRIDIGPGAYVYDQYAIVYAASY